MRQTFIIDLDYLALCRKDPYLLELILYIHLNPVRAGM